MALGDGASVKHVFGVLEWSYVVPEKPFFFQKWSLVRGDPPPTTRFGKIPHFLHEFLATFPKLVQFENRITYFEVNLIWPVLAKILPQTIKTDISAISATL